MNEFQQAVLAAARSMLGWPYRLGGTGKVNNEIDCRGLFFRVFKMIGLLPLIGGFQPNVRAYYKWAKDNGRLRDPKTYTPKPGDGVIYSSPTGKGPLKIAHIGIVIEPMSPQRPHGLAISALNPVEDVKEHRLDRKGLTILAYIEPDWPADVVDPPPVDPEPPVEPDPDAEYIAELEARIAAKDNKLKEALAI